MSHESHEDQFHDRPPPMKEPEEYAKEERKSARTGIAVLLVLALIGGRVIQVLSRRPGTSGPVMTIFGVLALGPFIVFYEQRSEELGATDAVSPGIFAMVFLAILGLDLVLQAVAAFRKRQLPPYQLGTGVLTPFLPGINYQWAGLLSDVAIGLGLYLGFSHFDSPIQAQFFLILSFWVVFTQAVKITHQAYLAGRIKQARKRVRYYPNEIRNW